MNTFALCELCSDNGPFFCCFSACPTCGDKANYCAACWNRWATVCEEQGRPTANCPHCRSQLCEEMVTEFLGRPYQQRQPKKQNQPTTTTAPRGDSHEFVRTMIALGLRRCPRCRIWIQREHVCNAIHCRCGARFCWLCGRDSVTCARIRCGQFYNNHPRQTVGETEKSMAKQSESENDAEGVQETPVLVPSTWAPTLTREEEARGFLRSSWKRNYKIRPRTGQS